MLVLSFGIQPAGATTLSQPVLTVTDTNPAASVFEADLSADEQDGNEFAKDCEALVVRRGKKNKPWRCFNAAFSAADEICGITDRRKPEEGISSITPRYPE
ncbi:MAG: hypothetical protein OEQ18_13925 [Gammaproteobacteria bacterium]|nr:hypothetical protein [Gammaproteobacteria bacterium]